MHFIEDKRLKNDIYPMIIIGGVIAPLLFGYGLYCLMVGECIVIGRGNFPFGTILKLTHTDARLVSFTYTGLGIYLFGHFLIGNMQKRNLSKIVSWIGVLSLLFGLFSLMVIMLLPII